MFFLQFIFQYHFHPIEQPWKWVLYFSNKETCYSTFYCIKIHDISNHPAYAYTHQNSDGMRKRARRKSEREKVWESESRWSDHNY